MSDMPPPPPGGNQPPPQWGQQPASPPWGQQPAAWGNNMAAYTVNPFDSRGTTVLVLGILGLVICQVLGPVAWIMGNSVQRDALAAGYPVPGNARAGRILGMIGTGLIALSILFVIVIVIVAAASSN